LALSQDPSAFSLITRLGNWVVVTFFFQGNQYSCGFAFQDGVYAIRLQPSDEALLVSAHLLSHACSLLHST
jgi:hypothetical protein